MGTSMPNPQQKRWLENRIADLKKYIKACENTISYAQAESDKNTAKVNQYQNLANSLANHLDDSIDTVRRQAEAAYNNIFGTNAIETKDSNSYKETLNNIQVKIKTLNTARIECFNQCNRYKTKFKEEYQKQEAIKAKAIKDMNIAKEELRSRERELRKLKNELSKYRFFRILIRIRR